MALSKAKPDMLAAAKGKRTQASWLRTFGFAALSANLQHHVLPSCHFFAHSPEMKPRLWQTAGAFRVVDFMLPVWHPPVCPVQELFI